MTQTLPNPGADGDRAVGYAGTCDVAIVGGGLVGTSLAVALQDTPLRVALIEAAPPPQSEASWDERCIALNDASRRIFRALGVWEALRADAEPILATHISERGRFGVSHFEAAEAGLEALGYNVPLRAIGKALERRVSQAPRLTLFRPARVCGLARGDAGVRLDLETSEGRRTLEAKLAVAADGARSALREWLGIEAQTRDYAQQAIVTAVRLSRPHRGVAYERFTPDGPLALIPKPGLAMSLVWTTPQAWVERRMGWSEAEFLAAAQETFGGRLGRFLELGRRWAYPLTRVLSERLTAPRVVFVGNAAQTLHPVAAQGFNLGLRDVAALAELLAEAADPGEAELLSAYERRRAQDRDRVADLTDLMVRVFSNRAPVLAQARHLGLVAVDLLPPLRRAVLQQHLGHLGLPRVS